MSKTDKKIKGFREFLEEDDNNKPNPKKKPLRENKVRIIKSYNKNCVTLILKIFLTKTLMNLKMNGVINE
jgi:hypothetical protein